MIVYSRPGCHLCDDAKEVLATSRCAALFTLEEVNIETDRALLHAYRNDIPVVTINGEFAFKHRVDAEEFCRKLAMFTPKA